MNPKSKSHEKKYFDDNADTIEEQKNMEKFRIQEEDNVYFYLVSDRNN